VFRNAFCQIGCEWNLSSDVLKTLHAFTCKLYASRTPDIDVNDLRFSLWRARHHSRQSLEAKPTIPARRMAMYRGSTESGGIHIHNQGCQ